MKVLIDTSAWVDFLNGYDSPEGAAVADLLAGEDDVCTCGVVVAEVFQGLRKSAQYGEIESLFKEMSFLEPAGIDAYLSAAGLYRSLRRCGITVRSTVDCLIAVLADANGCHVLARDRDMSGILRSGLLKARSWPT